MAERDKLVLTFKLDRRTARTVLFDEELGEQAYSSAKDIAVGNIYVMKEALELIGNPKRLKVTIEPLEGGE